MVMVKQEDKQLWLEEGAPQPQNQQEWDAAAQTGRVWWVWEPWLALHPEWVDYLQDEGTALSGDVEGL